MRRQDGTHPATLVVRVAVFIAAFLAVGSERVLAETISGTIRDPNGAPLNGATVSTSPLPFGSTISTATNASGQYTLTVTPGCWALGVHIDAYGTMLYPGTVFTDMRLPIEVASGQNRTGIDMQFPQGFSMGGTVVPSGALPSSYSVTLFGTWGEATTIVKTFKTSPWSMSYVPTGNYIVEIKDLGFPQLYAPQFYDGMNVEGAATLVHLTANRSDVNFTPQAAVHVTGIFRHTDNSVTAGDRVILYTRGNQESPLLAFTDSSGKFDLFSQQGGLEIGYQGQIVAFGGGGGHPASWTARGNQYGSFPSNGWLVLGPGINSGNDIDELEPATISGQVVDAVTNAPIQGVSVRTVDPSFVSRLGFNSFSASSDAGGNFTIFGVQPGRRYGVSATPPFTANNFYLSNSIPFFDVSPGATTGKTVGLSKGGKAGGMVTADNGGAPIPFVSVELWLPDCSGIRTNGSTDNTGTYLTPPVTPGMYKVHFSAPGGAGFVSEYYPNAATCNLATAVNITAGNTTTVNAALATGSPVGGHKVFGKVTASGGSIPIVSAFVELHHTGDNTFFFDFTDSCGNYEINGVPDAIFDAVVNATGFASLNLTNGVTVSGADVQKNFQLDALKGAIAGHVTTTGGGSPIQGAQVCTQNGNCATTDSSGFYWLSSLGSGTYNLISTAKDGLEPGFRNNVAVTNGSTTGGQDLAMGPVAADPLEPDAIGTPSLLARPEADGGPSRLLPDAPVNRAIQDTEDTDWFRFTATSGKVYHLAITGGGFVRYGAFLGVFDGVTHAADTSGASFFLLTTGWTAPSTGERWLAISASFSSSYTITLTEGSGGPPPPNVTSINPTSGPASGGTSVTITGTNFVAGATVKFGGVAATNVVVGAGGTTITCKSPADAAGSLNDVVVTNPDTQASTLTKGWFADFTDVAQAYLYHAAIEKLVRAGITSGCGGGKFCPTDPVTRDAMAKFLLVAKHGAAFNPPAATGNVFCDVTTGTLLAKWIEEFFNEGFTSGCSGGACGKPDYCPTAMVTRDGMSKFLLLAKNGASFSPPAATGTVFCDVTAATFLAKWMEELKAENITGGCGAELCARLGGASTPDFCPTGIVTRGEMAKFLKIAFNL